MTPVETERDFSDDLGDLATHGCTVHFNISEDGRANPFTRRWVCEVSAQVRKITIGGLTLTREQAVTAWGADTIRAIEDDEADRLTRDMAA